MTKPRLMPVSLYDIAQQYIGVQEFEGEKDNPIIMAAFYVAGATWFEHDEVPWCSVMMCLWAAQLPGIPYPKSARARSWLGVGRPIDRDDVRLGWDVVIFNRGGSADPSDMNGPGHVGLFAGWADRSKILVLGGNQSNKVKISSYNQEDILGFRRLYG